MAVSFLLLIYFSNFRNKLDYIEYEGTNIERPIYVGTKPSIEKIIIDINEKTNSSFKLKLDKNLDGGRTRIMFNTIEINPFMAPETFVWVYVHEIFHHKFFTHNELFVEFETFKFLYESDDEFYKTSALIELSKMNKENLTYDARYYIYNYLKEKEE